MTKITLKTASLQERSTDYIKIKAIRTYIHKKVSSNITIKKLLNYIRQIARQPNGRKNNLICQVGCRVTKASIKENFAFLNGLF